MSSRSLRTGQLIKIGCYSRDGRNYPNVVKLYSDLNKLKHDPFMGFDKALKIEPNNAALITMIVETSPYDYVNAYLVPKVEAVKIIYEHNTWWIFSYDIHEILTD